LGEVRLTEALGRRVAAAERLVVFTGAGISAESGLGTFRGAGGLWERFRPEELATPAAFERDPALVWRWYAERFAAMRRADPNPAHLAIAGLEGRFPSLVVVTQNIDRLHQRAGSSDVIELHGTAWESHCVRCGRTSATAELAPADPPPPRCSCGGRFRPSVVWFGESLPRAGFERATNAASGADLFVVVGTSATVWPAAGLIEVAADAGALVIEVNREETPLTPLADLHCAGAAGEVLPELCAELERWGESGAGDRVDP
jgi:NAD-dependent deacetylase